MKTPSLVIPDIYKMLESRDLDPKVDVDDIVNRFGEACQDFLRGAIAEEQDRSGLRLSSIGKPMRKLWQQFYGIRGEPIDGPTYIKFLYGHLTEAMVLALVELSGHEVTEQQKEVEVDGVKGHQDCRIDGMLVDVKSASSYGFKKFKYNTLHNDDPFAYIPQLKAYAHQEGDTKYAWLAMDKQNGTLAWLEYDESDTNAPYYDTVNYDIVEHVQSVKKQLEGELPSLCYEDLPDGKSGNRKLASGCAYCEYKQVCYPNLRTFNYSNGPRYLTKVVKDPRVLEVPDGF